LEEDEAGESIGCGFDSSWKVELVLASENVFQQKTVLHYSKYSSEKNNDRMVVTE